MKADDFDESPIAAFERVAATFPSRVALSSDVWEPTYQGLNETANRLALRLIACGVASGDRVAILMSHDAPTIAAVLGILKAGSIVVALDPADPVSRLQMLVEDAEPNVIVTDVQNRNLAAEFEHSGCSIWNFESETATGRVHNPSIEIPPEQTAFLTYTSGTTGRPKGVMKTHRQLRRAAAVHSEAMRYTENDRIPLFATISTGWGATELWFLLNGAMLCPFPLKTRGITGLADWIIDRDLTVYVSSVSVFRSLVQTIDRGLVFSNVRAVGLGGEAATADDFKTFRMHFPQTSIFVHTLSSSETSNIAWARWTQNDHVPEGVLPVGYFSRDIDISLLGEDGQPVARGEVGEIVVKSRYMATGYWRQPALTAERFSGTLGGVRQFRTGDMGRINANGQLELAGRRDARVKIRGNRIELSEVEGALQRLPGVKQAVVDAIERENNDPLLVGYIVADGGRSWPRARLRTELRSLVPDYMVPSVVLLLDTLPLASTGKIDREKLREIYQSSRRRKSTASMTATEALIAKVWADAFEVPEIGRDDDFFELGGDSLIATVISARLYTLLGVEIGLETFVDYPKLAAFAQFIDDTDKEPTADVEPEITFVPRAATIPLSWFQEHWWSALQAERGAWGQAGAHSYRILGPLDIEVLRDCMTYLAGRHEVLRTSFAMVDGAPVQVIHSPAKVRLPYLDLSGTSDAEARAELLFNEEAARDFDVSVPSLLRHRLVKIAENEHLLLRTSHHIIADGPSWNIYYRELAHLYEARIHGVDLPSIESAPLQYADYVNWQRNVLLQDGERSKDQIAWWKGLFLHEPLPLNLPFQRAEPLPNIDPNEGVISWGLPPDVSRRLNELGRKESATYYVVRLAAFAALLAAETEDRDVVVGSYLNCRRHEAVQEMLGLFSNPVTIILNCDLTSTFREWLLVVRQHYLTVHAHADIPHEWLRRVMDKHNVVMPEIRAILTVRTPLRGPLRFAGVEMRSLERPPAKMPSGFTVFLAEENEEEGCLAYFDARKYDPAGVRHLIDHLKDLLDAVSREPDAPMNQLLGVSASQLTERALERHKAERAGLLERNRALRVHLQESEADRAARLEQINLLTNALKETEADRAARLEQINILTGLLKEAEADRAARLEQINLLTNALKETEADRAARLKVIDLYRLKNSEADHTAQA